MQHGNEAGDPAISALPVNTLDIVKAILDHIPTGIKGFKLWWKEGRRKRKKGEEMGRNQGHSYPK